MKTQHTLSAARRTLPPNFMSSISRSARHMVDDLHRSGAADIFEEDMDAAGLLPPAKTEAEIEQQSRVTESILESFFANLLASGEIERAFIRAIQGHQGVAEPDRQEGIREFFTSPKDDYSLDELADLWGLPIRLVKAALPDDDFDPESTPGRASRVDAISTALHFGLLTPDEIENAVGDAADKILPPSWRTEVLVLRLPRWMYSVLVSDAAWYPREVPPQNKIEAILMDYFDRYVPTLPV